MEKLEAKKSYYKIQKILGSGLTSDVYKAFRVDGEGWTKQEVALKIIKSRKDVQILKKEFESLSQVKSKYCVNILAWENLKQGPALVLEYIDGVTLHQLMNRTTVSESLIIEIIAQVHMGLRGLHKHRVFHGDLNLKNIMINSEGIVKLIDFGFQGAGNTQYLTPSFSSQERLSGAPPTSESDRYSLIKIAEHLFEYILCRPGSTQAESGERPKSWSERALKETTKARARRELAKLVQLNSIQNSTSTRQVTQVKKKNSSFMKCAVSFLLFFGVLFFTPFGFHSPQYSQFSMRGQRWFKVSINNMPFQYGPIESKSLRPGNYKIRWVSADSSGQSSVDLIRQSKFLLQPEYNDL